MRNAFPVEDAYITFRTVDNFVHGLGLTWNAGERVQAYTHPLWMFLVTAVYFFTLELPFTVTFVSVALSVGTAWMIGSRIARSTGQAALAVGVLTLSKAFMDYSSSGLENPLTHFLLALFLVEYLREEAPSNARLFRLTLLSALAALNRLDTILLNLPCLALEYANTADGRMRLRALAGFAPLVAWEAFSLFYYGAPFPNTAYAKLGAGVPAIELAHQGVLYFLNSLDWDPVTLATVGTSLAAAALRGRPADHAIAAGLLLYLAYVVRIGGCSQALRPALPSCLCPRPRRPGKARRCAAGRKRSLGGESARRRAAATRARSPRGRELRRLALSHRLGLSQPRAQRGCAPRVPPRGALPTRLRAKLGQHGFSAGRAGEIR